MEFQRVWILKRDSGAPVDLCLSVYNIDSQFTQAVNTALENWKFIGGDYEDFMVRSLRNAGYTVLQTIKVNQSNKN